MLTLPKRLVEKWEPGLVLSRDWESELDLLLFADASAAVSLWLVLLVPYPWTDELLPPPPGPLFAECRGPSWSVNDMPRELVRCCGEWTESRRELC